MAIEIHDVLAAAYVRGGVYLTHAVEVDARGDWVRVLCNRVNLDNICDAVRPGPPTCKTRATRMAKET